MKPASTSAAAALLSTLFFSRGAIQLTAGDEMGRSQSGNNNAYAQDNALSWLDWKTVDRDILAHAQALSALRLRFAIFAGQEFLTETDVAWLNADGETMQAQDWDGHGPGHLTMVLETIDRQTSAPARLAIAFNRAHEDRQIHLPGGMHAWKRLMDDGMQISARSVGVFLGKPAG